MAEEMEKAGARDMRMLEFIGSGDLLNMGRGRRLKGNYKDLSLAEM